MFSLPGPCVCDEGATSQDPDVLSFLSSGPPSWKGVTHGLGETLVDPGLPPFLDIPWKICPWLASPHCEGLNSSSNWEQQLLVEIADTVGRSCRKNILFP